MTKKEKKLRKRVNVLKFVTDNPVTSWLKSRSRKKKQEERSLPTNDTLEKHRRTIIRQGRRHLKSLGVAEHKVVYLSVSIFSAVLVALVILYLYSVYIVVSTTSITRAVSGVLPTPVVVFNDSRINYNTVLFQYRTAQNVQNLEQTEIQNKAGLFEKAISKAVENQAIRELGKKQQIVITKEEFEQRIAEPIELAGGSEKFEQSLEETYGWSRKDFENEFRVQLIFQKILPSRMYELSSAVSSGSSFLRTAEGLEFDIATVAIETGGSLPNQLVKNLQKLEAGNSTGPVLIDGVYFYAYKTSPTNVAYVTTTELQKQVELDAFILESRVYTCLNKDQIGTSFATNSWISCVKP